MNHFTKSDFVLQTQLDKAVLSKNPDLFIKTMARNLWTPRGPTLRCLKNNLDLKLAVLLDKRKPITPAKVGIFLGKYFLRH